VLIIRPCGLIVKRVLPLFVKTFVLVVFIACGIGHDLIGCHVLKGDPISSACGSPVVVGIIFPAVIAIC